MRWESKDSVPKIMMFKKYEIMSQRWNMVSNGYRSCLFCSGWFERSTDGCRKEHRATERRRRISPQSELDRPIGKHHRNCSLCPSATGIFRGLAGRLGTMSPRADYTPRSYPVSALPPCGLFFPFLHRPPTKLLCPSRFALFGAFLDVADNGA